MSTDANTGGDRAESTFGGGAPRGEMESKPPFSSWGAIYGVVLGALAAQVLICAVLTAIYR